MLPLSVFLTAGALKHLPVLEHLPVDLTVFAACVVGIQVATLFVRDWVIPSAVPWIVTTFGLLLFGVARAPLSPYATEKTARLFTLTLLACVGAVFLVRNRAELRRFVSCVAAISVGLALFSLANQDALTETEFARLGVSDDGNPLTLGRFAGLGLLVIVIRFPAALTKRAVAVGAIAACGWALTLSVSQGPAVGVLAGLLAAAFAAGSVRTRVRRIAAVALLAVIVVLALQGFSDVHSDALLSAGRSEDTRLDAYRSALDAMAENPGGVGIGNYGISIEHPWVLDETGVAYPHNMWLETVLEAGWLVGAFVLFLTVMAAIRSFKSGDPLLAGVVAYVLANAAVSGDLNDNRIALTLIFVALGITAQRSPLLAVDVGVARRERVTRLRRADAGQSNAGAA